jgi:ketosteroid isomerase-like protein
MDTFLNAYRQLNRNTLYLLDDMYDTDVLFIDPAHQIKGREELRKYFSNLYENISTIDFHFHSPIRNDNEGYVHWEMVYSHPKIGKGREIKVHGASFLHFTTEGKVRYHRDFFDLGTMLYQHLPILGPIVKSINRRLNS